MMLEPFFANFRRYIERNLSAVVKTSQRHHQNLQEHVRNATFLTLTYEQNDISADYECADSPLRVLRQIYKQMKAQSRSDVIAAADEQSSDSAQKGRSRTRITGNEISSLNFIRTLFSQASVIHRSVGSWAANWYIGESIRHQDDVNNHGNADPFTTSANDDTCEGKLFEATRLRALLGEPILLNGNMSPKTLRLVEFLETDMQSDSKILIFAEQRAVVTALAKLLSHHPKLESKISVGTFTGSSSCNRIRKSAIKDISQAVDQKQVLQDFKSGTKNLIVATSVLEEGIDISSCQVVICFDPPNNPLSFIQRRGRARQPNSRFILLISDDEPNIKKLEEWKALEFHIREACVDSDLRPRQSTQQESHQDVCKFIIEKTGAQLTFENAMAHLYHFCTTVSTDRYSDCRPQFSVYPTFDHLYTAEVILPTSTDPSVRFACSSQKWRSQGQARKDAAFQAYVQLYKTGLINENLLPLIKDFDDRSILQGQGLGLSLVPVISGIDPWQNISDKHKRRDKLTKWNRAAASLRFNGLEYIKCTFILPAEIVPIHRLRLHWDIAFDFDFTLAPIASVKYKDSEIIAAKKVTFALLRSVYGGRMKSEEDDFLVYILPTESITLKSYKATDVYEKVKGQHNSKLVNSLGLVHEIRRHGIKRVFGGFQWGYELNPEWVGRYSGNIESSELYIRTTRLSSKSYIYCSMPSHLAKRACRNTWPRKELLRAKDCVIDGIPLPYTIFALFIPTIFHRLRGNMLANLLCNDTLAHIQLSNLELILAAITASSASDLMNYQRLEFLGDCILKYCSSLQLMAQHASWPESYLTAAKEKMVSNKNLTKVSIAHRFSRFTVLKAIKITKWRPQLVRNFNKTAVEDERTFRSAKMQADIVEALIGATFVEAGITKSSMLFEKLLTNNTCFEYDRSVGRLYNMIPAESTRYLQDNKLEDLIGYHFSKKIILREALTHASFSSHYEICSLSYERLEYLGDAVLDQIVSDIIFSRRPLLPHAIMHTVRTAVVSTAFLAFTCIEFSQNERRFNLPNYQSDFSKVNNTRRSIWQFMRHASSEIAFVQRETIRRHAENRSAILIALEKDIRHPWHLLSRIRASKFFADLIESIIGAIYIDSQGSLSTCLGFLERLGITRYLRRVLDKGIDCLHPKERLGILACSNRLRYHHEKSGELYRCWVYLNEVLVGAYAESTTVVDAEVNAAWAASEFLESSIKGL